jgi:uncharacterized RmlC-like cupin family protein
MSYLSLLPTPVFLIWGAKAVLQTRGRCEVSVQGSTGTIHTALGPFGGKRRFGEFLSDEQRSLCINDDPFHDNKTVPSEPPDWQHHGVKIVRAGELDSNTPQTPGMTRAAAITHARTGASRLWAGTVVVQPDAKTGPHHHGELETVLYIVKGRARMRWGDHLEFTDEAGPGDFIFVPPWVPHQEINARADEPCEAVVVRSGQDPIVVNLPMESPEPASAGGAASVPFHPKP